MSGITLEQAQAQLDRYIAAEAAVLLGQSYEIAGRKLTRANLGDIQRGIELWSGRVVTARSSSLGRGRSRTIVAGG